MSNRNYDHSEHFPVVYGRSPNAGPDETFTVTYGTDDIGYAYGEDSWVKGDILSSYHMEYVSRKARQKAMRTMRMLERAKLAKDRRMAFLFYKANERKRFTQYRSDYLQRKVYAADRAFKEYLVLEREARKKIFKAKSRMLRVPLKENQRIKITKHDLFLEIGETEASLRRLYGPKWEYIPPESFPKRLWDIDVKALYRNQYSIRKTRRIKVNFCNSYYAFKYKGSIGGLVVEKSDSPGERMPTGELYREWFVEWKGSSPSVNHKPVFEDLTWTANDEIALIAKLSIKYHMHELNAGNFLVEGHRVYAMLKSIVTTLSAAIKALINHDFHRLFREWDNSGRNKPDAALKTAASGWLALQYGIIPLIDDVFKMGEAAAAYELTADVAPYELHVSRSIIRESVNVPYIGRFSGWNMFGEATFDDTVMTISITEKITKRYVVQLEPTRQYLFQNLGLASPIQALWEVSPYSFLVDWILMIQRTLEAETALREIPMKAVLKSVKKKTWYKGLAFTASANVKFVDFQPVDGICEEFSRSPVFDLVVPRPTLRPLDQALSGKHLSILFALLIQLLKSKHLYYDAKDLKTIKRFLTSTKGRERVYEPDFMGPIPVRRRKKQPLDAAIRDEN